MGSQDGTCSPETRTPAACGPQRREETAHPVETNPLVSQKKDTNANSTLISSLLFYLFYRDNNAFIQRPDTTSVMQADHPRPSTFDVHHGQNIMS